MCPRNRDGPDAPPRSAYGKTSAAVSHWLSWIGWDGINSVFAQPPSSIQTAAGVILAALHSSRLQGAARDPRLRGDPHVRKYMSIVLGSMFHRPDYLDSGQHPPYRPEQIRGGADQIARSSCNKHDHRRASSSPGRIRLRLHPLPAREPPRSRACSGGPCSGGLFSCWVELLAWRVADKAPMARRRLLSTRSSPALPLAALAIGHRSHRRGHLDERLHGIAVAPGRGTGLATTFVGLH